MNLKCEKLQLSKILNFYFLSEPQESPVIDYQTKCRLIEAPDWLINSLWQCRGVCRTMASSQSTWTRPHNGPTRSCKATWKYWWCCSKVIIESKVLNRSVCSQTSQQPTPQINTVNPGCFCSWPNIDQLWFCGLIRHTCSLTFLWQRIQSDQLMRKVIRRWVVMHTVSVRMMEVWHHHSADRQLWWRMRCSNVLLVSGKQRLQHFFIFLQLFTWFVESSEFNFLAFEVDVFWSWSCNKTKIVFVDVERQPSPLLSDGDPVMCLPAQCVVINSISCHVTPLSEGPMMVSTAVSHCFIDTVYCGWRAVILQ